MQEDNRNKGRINVPFIKQQLISNSIYIETQKKNSGTDGSISTGLPVSNRLLDYICETFKPSSNNKIL